MFEPLDHDGDAGWMRAAEVATYWSVPVGTVRLWADQGLPTAHRLDTGRANSPVLYSRRQVKALVIPVGRRG